MMKSGRGLCPGAAGLSVGIIWGLSSIICSLLFHGSMTMVGSMGAMQIGYGSTVMGSLIAGLWGLLHGFIAGFLVAWLYNCVCKCCKCRFCKGACGDENSCACNCKDCCSGGGCDCKNCDCKSCGSKKS